MATQLITAESPAPVPIMETGESTPFPALDHSYASALFEEQLGALDQMLNEVRDANSTNANVRPAKKSKTLQSEDDEELDVDMIPKTTAASLLSIVQNIERMQRESLRRLMSLEGTVNQNSASIQSLCNSMVATEKKVDEAVQKTSLLQSKVDVLEKENHALRKKCNELDAYQRRMNLRVSGIPERAGEDVKKMMIDLFGQVSPAVADQLPLFVDVAHRLGPRSEDERSSRRIIVRFSHRSIKERIQRDARTAEILKVRNIMLTDDLTQETRDARNELWPLVAQARKEKKKAGFRGAFAFIEGKRISVKDIRPPPNPTGTSDINNS